MYNQFVNKYAKIINSILVLVILSIIGVSILFYFKDFTPKMDKENSNKPSEKNSKDKDNDKTPIAPAKLVYPETPAKNSASYFEKTPIIEGQQAYIAYPLEINPDNPPTLIVYNHGSNTTVTTNFKDQFMKDLQMYGEFFASKGYAFAASNQHGANNGNQASIDDNNNLINWIKKEYKIKEKVNLIGFSMGGRPTIYFTQQNSSRVRAIAMLAPATCYCSSDLYNSLKDIPIKIWHGTADVNVPYSAAQEFISRSKPYSLDITLRTINGVGHFDIDTEYIEEIYEFFETNE